MNPIATSTPHPMTRRDPDLADRVRVAFKPRHIWPPMGRLSRSWDMFKTSMTVIRQDKELLWMPVLSFLATVIAILAIAGVGITLGGIATVTGNGGLNVLGLLWAFMFYIAVAYVQVFFHAATVSAANERLGGGDPTVGSALRGAWKHAGRLFLWAIIVATVNVILQMIRERAGFLGQIMASFAGMAWNLATYFVVPVLMFEDQGIGQSLKRSGAYFKKTWGETVVGEIGLGWAATAAIIVTVILGGIITFALASVAGVAGLIIGLALLAIGVIGIAIIFTVAAAVYKTALFRYASQGRADGPFQTQDLANSWVPSTARR